MAMAVPMETSPAMECPKCNAVHNPDHCDGHNRAGHQCGKAKGHGTDHKGWGNCDNHAGNTPAGRTHAQRAKDAVMEILWANAPKAARRIVRLVDDSEATAPVQLRASTELLDRIGIVPPRRLEHSGPDGGPIPVDVRVAELVERARQIRSGGIIDTTLAEEEDDG